jgi:methyl coenzyme M reductase beta subunit
MNDVWAAAVALVAVAKKARKRLAGTNIMGQKLDLPLVEEIDAVIAHAQRAIDAEEKRALEVVRVRATVRDLAEQRRQNGA